MASPRTTSRSLPGFLTTRFGRRLFGVFVLSALLPITGLAALAFVQVTDELHQQAERRLRAASRAAGMRVFDRLGQLEVELGALDSRLMEGSGAQELEPGRRARLERGFRALWILAPGRSRRVLGDSGEPPTVELQGRSAALALDRRSRGYAIYLARRLGATPESALVAVGEVDPDHLFDISHENALPPLSEFVLLDSENRVLRSSWDVSEEDLHSLTSALAESGDSLVERRLGDSAFLVRGWSLFLESSYGHPPWTVIVLEPKQVALAPIARFRAGFVLILFGTVALIALLTTGQIRRRLVPLETLREGTERIARREFDVRLSVSSRDELEEVAGSFNAMAAQLSTHFESLGRLAEIDREVLSAPDEARMVETLVLRAGEIYPCDTVAVLISGQEEGSSPRLLWLTEGTVSEAAASPLLEEEQAELRRNPLQLHVELDPGESRYLPLIGERELSTAVVLPLLSGPALLGFIAFGHGPRETLQEDRILYARQLADQFASALSDVRARSENYALAHFDPLTGLPNRKLFAEQLREAMIQARRREETIAVFVADLDGFKRFCSAVGSSEADRLLIELATRLSSLPSLATVGRLGGDEFGVLVRNLSREDGAYQTVSNALAAVSGPVRLSRGEQFYPVFSAGVALFPGHGEDPELLVQRAATALDEARDAGGGDCRVYSSTLGDQARHRLSLESQLRRAVAQDELCLHYQPVVDLQRGDIVGAEALLRWRHPERGLVSPDEFIALSEETGLIVPMGEFALREACAAAGRWLGEERAAIRVNVNLSGRQLGEGNLLGMIRRVLLEANTIPSSLGLELTESMLMNADASTTRTLEALKDLGIRLFVDDFGTGYSCLSYLSQLPIDALKIDRSFVRGVPDDPSSVALSRAIIAMAKGLGLALVAEGVETEAHVAFLREQGCELGQGSRFSMPLPESEFRALLRGGTVSGS